VQRCWRSKSRTYTIIIFLR